MCFETACNELGILIWQILYDFPLERNEVRKC